MWLIKTHLHLMIPRHAVFARTTRSLIGAKSVCLAAYAAQILPQRTGLEGRPSQHPRPYVPAAHGVVASNVLVSILCELDR